MKINGKAIAQDIFEDLKRKVEDLKAKNITPHLAIILVGNDPASEAYVRQKMLKAENIGIKTTLERLPIEITEPKLISVIEKLNNNHEIHGIIVQRPLPAHINPDAINNAVTALKDVDAFQKHSPYVMPLAGAVLKILEYINEIILPPADQNINKNEKFITWLQSKYIVIVGKGQTGGGPTIKLLEQMGIYTEVIDSKTQNPENITEKADIIISAIGRSKIIDPKHLKKGVILIGVGMHKGTDGKLHGDYEENDIKGIASYYTPIPGGIGPVNVAMLLKNVVESAKKINVTNFDNLL